MLLLNIFSSGELQLVSCVLLTDDDRSHEEGAKMSQFRAAERELGINDHYCITRK